MNWIVVGLLLFLSCESLECQHGSCWEFPVYIRNRNGMFHEKIDAVFHKERLEDGYSHTTTLIRFNTSIESQANYSGLEFGTVLPISTGFLSGPVGCWAQTSLNASYVAGFVAGLSDEFSLLLLPANGKLYSCVAQIETARIMTESV